MNNELIPIIYDNGHPTTSARALHEFLAVDTPFRKWFPRMCEYGFTKGADYTPDIFVHPTNQQETTDYQLTLGMAKELCMIQRTEKGKQARQYFIAAEEQHKAQLATGGFAIPQTFPEALRLAANLAEQNERRQQLIGELKPKADYVDSTLMIRFSFNFLIKKAALNRFFIYPNKLNKILHDEGIQRKVGDQWILYKEHMGKGYTQSETIPITRTGGQPDTKLFTRWTQKGRLMINDVLNKRGIYANIEFRGVPA